MNDKNFDSLKNLKTPEKWIENAKKIPQIQSTKPIFFIRYSKQIMAVACLVLVCTISLIIVLQKDNGKILVVDPDYQTTSTECQTEETEIISDNQNHTEANKEKQTSENTKTENGGAPFEESQNAVDPTQNESSAQSQKPSNSENETGSSVKPTDKEHVVPTQISTQIEKEEQTEAVPTQRPTHPKPTKPPIKPVNEPKPEAPQAPTPTDGAPEVPSQPSNPTISQPMATSFYVQKPCGTTFYCLMFDPDGKLIGDDDLFSEKRKAVVVRDYTDGMYLNYYPENNYKLTKLGRYTYFLYDENGNLLQQHYVVAEY